MSNKKETAINEIINEFNCNPLHRIALREIFKSCDDEKTKIGTVYEKVGSKLNKNPTTIKSILTKTIAEIGPDCLRKVLGIEKKSLKNKEFVNLLISKAKESAEKESINE